MTDESTSPQSAPSASGDAPPPAPPAEPAPAAAPAAKAGLAEWLWRGHALDTAKERAKAHPETLERRRIAEVALEVAERTREPVDPFRRPGAAEQSLDLYRKAVRWGLLVHGGPADADLGALLDLHPTETAAAAAAAGADVATLRPLLVDADPVRDLLEKRGTEHLPAIATFARALVRASTADERAVDDVLFSRFVRTLTLLVLLVGVTLGATLGVLALMKKPDLGKGRPWRASSSWATCEPQKRTCGAVTDTAIFFHTNEDANPWFELDVGPGHKYSSMTIKNRSDFGPDRAVPLVVEVSDDQATWREIARRTETFSTWKPTFAPQSARWVRLRVLRKSWLHLEQVSVHP